MTTPRYGCSSMVAGRRQCSCQIGGGGGAALADHPRQHSCQREGKGGEGQHSPPPPPPPLNLTPSPQNAFRSRGDAQIVRVDLAVEHALPHHLGQLAPYPEGAALVPVPQGRKPPGCLRFRRRRLCFCSRQLPCTGCCCCCCCWCLRRWPARSSSRDGVRF